MQVERLDHCVLTVADVGATARFYERALGMRAVTFGANRTALRFGRAKINLHPASHPICPHAERPTPGSADLCFVSASGIDEVIAHLRRCGIAIEEGPVPRSGALGPMVSVYIRDPDRNLIEICSYAESDARQMGEQMASPQ